MTKAFGGVITQHLGLGAVPTVVTQSAKRARMEVSRLSCGVGQGGGTEVIPREDSFVVMLHLADYRHHELWRRRRRPIHAPSYPKGSITIVNLMDELSVNVGSPLDSLSFYIPRVTLDAFIEEVDGPSITTLACAPATLDPVLASLGAALLPVLESPEAGKSLFVDQVGLALQAHLAVTYGGLRLPARSTRSLSGWQQARAKEMLQATPLEKVSVDDVAAACGMSRSYFIRSFKAATGRTPHRWLLEQRVEQAKRLLLGPQPIADIALECEFTDQSHLSRIFKSFTGVPPGVWRRLSKGEPAV